MGNENGEWVIRGLREDDPRRIKTPWELLDYINTVGFLPLFSNEIPGFSAEEHTAAVHWWSGDETCDPWEWRRILARSGRVAYGKFFAGKAGYISLEWLPYFANYRRDGYDFDALWDDERAKYRSKRMMDLFTEHDELFSFEMKRLLSEGEGCKGFESTLNELQMQTYLTVRDFRQRLNKKGEPYGWSVGVYTTPEKLWGEELVTSAYGEDARISYRRIVDKLLENFPADENSIKKNIGI